MQLIDITGLINWLVFIFSLLLAAVILRKDLKSRSNKTYVFSCVVTGLWSISLYFYNHPIVFHERFWLNMAYTLTYLIILGHLFFAYYFPYKVKFPFKRILIGYLLLVTIGLSLLWFSKTVVVNIKNYPEKGISETEMGWGYLIYSLPLAIPFITTVALYIKKNKVLKGYEKAQLKFYLLGVLVMGSGLFFVDVLLPIVFKNTQLYGISPVFMIIYFCTVAYSIIKYRFLGMRFFWGKFFYYVLTATIPFSFFYLIAFIMTQIWGSIFATGAILSGIGIAFIYIIVYWKLDELIQKFLERTLIYAEYDPYETINKLLKITSTELSMEKVVVNVLAIVRQALTSEKVGLVLFDKNNRKVLYKRLIGFEKNAHRNMRDLLEVVNFWDFQENLGKKSEILVLEELEAHHIQRSDEEEKRLKKIIHFMKEEKIAVVLPLNRKAQLNGLLMVGTKEGEEAYTVQDIDLLESIVANASVAVGRALLYKEVGDFAKTLGLKVDEATADLENKVDALEAARRRERDLLDILGHELRTPLSIIKSALGLIKMKRKQDTLSNEDIDKNIDAAEESLEREIKIVDTLLGATKLEANKLELHPEEVDIIDVVEDGLEAQHREISKKGLKEIFKRPEGKFPTVYADRTRIQEVYDNLLSNAVKYTSKGSIVTTLDQDEDFVFVTLKDTGIGIPKKDLRKLGTKFYRVRQYSQKGEKLRMVRPGGSGLGLYVTFGYIRAMGGDIKVKSDLGKGSKFTFSVPKYKGQKVTKSEKSEKDVFRRMGLTK